MSGFIREQNAVMKFREQCNPLLKASTEFKGSSLSDFAHAVINGIAFIGESELYARQAERCRVLKIHSGRIDFCLDRFQRLNVRGLENLKQAKKILNQLSKDVEKYTDEKKDILTDEQISEFHRDMNEIIVELEVKASDLEEVDSAVNKFLDVVKRERLGGIPNYLEERLNELSQLRQKEHRGASKNLAPWKIVALIVLVGVVIMNFIHCSFFGCTISDASSYIAGYTVLALVLAFC